MIPLMAVVLVLPACDARGEDQTTSQGGGPTASSVPRGDDVVREATLWGAYAE